MRALILSKAFGAALIMQAAVGFAAAPANAPPGTTGLCKDGTYYSGATKSGACKGHKGVKEWYGTAAAATPPASAPAPAKPVAAAPTPAAAPAAAAAPATPAAAPATAAPAPKAQTQTPPATSSAAKVAAAPGGGTGKVWVNKSTKVYHCAGTRWYGKTKEGEYMSETEATSQGFKPDHGKACK